MLHRMVYVSAARAPLAAEDLAQILATSRWNNARDGITGLMLYHDRQVLQVLEGEGAQIERTFRRIALDRRHGGLITLWSGPADARVFADWQMGLVRLPDLGEEAREAVVPLLDLARGVAPMPDDPRVAALMRGFFRLFSAFELGDAVEG
jgi:hypothetical protein